MRKLLIILSLPLFFVGCKPKTFEQKIAKYPYVGEFHENYALVKNKKGKYGFIDKEGELAIPCKYSEAREFINGMAAVKPDVYWTFVNKRGEQLSESYPEVGDFTQGGVARVRLSDRKYGLINSSGKFVVDPIYAYIGDFVKGFALTSDSSQESMINNRNQKWGMLNWAGKEILPCVYSRVYDFQEGRARVLVGDLNKTGYIDGTGKFVIPPKYFFAHDFVNGVAVVGLDIFGGFGIIDKNGKEIVPCIHRNIYNFSDGLALVTNERANPYFDIPHYSGYYNTKGELAIPIRYHQARSFSEGYAAVSQRLKWGYIDTKGEPLTDYIFDKAEPFSEGMALVYQKNKGYGFIDKTGKIVIPCKYAKAASFSNGKAKVTHVSKKMYINKEGKEVY